MARRRDSPMAPRWSVPTTRARAIRGAELLGEISREARAFGDRERELAVLAVARDGHADALPRAQRADARDVILMVAHGLAVDRGDDVAAEQIFVALEHDG